MIRENIAGAQPPDACSHEGIGDIQMRKQAMVRDDGRYLIYFTFAREREKRPRNTDVKECD